MKKGEVWSVEFPLEEDPDRILNRPVIVLDENLLGVLSVKITKHKAKIEDPYDIPIIYWDEAGSRLASTARVSKVTLLTKDSFIFKIGDFHKDDLKIFMNGNAADLFASQGQQRTIVLSLKIALIELIKDEIGEYPVLLLDDVLSELDEARKNMLLDILNQKIQTFITTTSIDGIEHHVIKEAKKININRKEEQ